MPVKRLKHTEQREASSYYHTSTEQDGWASVIAFGLSPGGKALNLIQ